MKSAEDDSSSLREQFGHAHWIDEVVKVIFCRNYFALRAYNVYLTGTQSERPEHRIKYLERKQVAETVLVLPAYQHDFLVQHISQERYRRRSDTKDPREWVSVIDGLRIRGSRAMS